MFYSLSLSHPLPLLLLSLSCIHRASTVADTCELVITKLVIKELWHICVEGLHRMLLPMLKYDQDGGGERSSEIQFIAHHYNTKQCCALEALAEILKVRW